MDRRLLVAGVLLSILVAGCGTEQPIHDASDIDVVMRVGQGNVYLGCEEPGQRALDLDVPGPGKSTPDEAAAPFVAVGSVTVTSETEAPLRRGGRQGDAVDGVAYVQVFGADQLPVRVIRVVQRKDGWWPDAYAECDQPRPTMLARP